MKLFITGTDTGIGKTITSCYLCKYFSSRGRRVAFYKPVQTGKELDTDFVREHCSDITISNSYTFALPAAPSLAADLEGVEISFERIRADLRQLEDNHEIVIIEGAGGVCVPITSSLNTVDLIKYLNTPALLVSANKLGTINHTCLSIECLKLRGVNLLGLIFSGLREMEEGEVEERIVSEHNLALIEQQAGRISFWGELPMYRGEGFDLDKRLDFEQYFC